MIEELEGTVGETIRRLSSETLDPRDETKFCETWRSDDGRRYRLTLEGRFLESGYRFHLRHVGGYDGVQHIADAIYRNKKVPGYRGERLKLLPFLDAWLRIARENPWIRAGYDPPFTEASLSLCRTVEELARMVDRNNWTVGTAFVLADTDLCMIQQCDGPGEFLMIRGARAFDSWTTGAPFGMHGQKLVASLQAVVRAPLDARGHPKWYELVERPPEEAAGVIVARSAAELSQLLG